jgi:hypothetical protein
LTTKQESSVLQWFENVTGIGYNLKTLGFSSTAAVQRMRERTAPDQIWFPAYEHAHTQRTVAMMAHCTALSANGDWRALFQRLTNIIAHLKLDIPSEFCDEYANNGDRRCVRQTQTLLFLDVATLLTALMLVGDWPDEFENYLGNIEAGVDNDRAPGGLLAGKEHGNIFVKHLKAVGGVYTMVTSGTTTALSSVKESLKLLQDIAGWDKVDEAIADDVPLMEDFVQIVEKVRLSV